MLIITEIRSPIRGFSFKINRVLNQGGVPFHDKTVSIWPVKREMKNGFVFMFLYNSKMEIIPEVFKYLNDQLKRSPDTTRESYLWALKLLFSFVEILSKHRRFRPCSSTEPYLPY